MAVLTRVADKAGLLGSIVSAMGCAACFPALANLGAAAGLGFLGRWEGLFITTLIPLFAALALLANGLGWLSHRRWRRTVLGVIGPLLVVAAAVVTRFYGLSTESLLYAGLTFMVGVSAWDLISAPRKVSCATDSAVHS